MFHIEILKVCLPSRVLSFHSKTRRAIFFVLVCALFLTTACREQPTKTSTPVPSPEVIITAMTAEVIGELVNVDGCLRIRNEESDVDYILVWPPDIAATVESDKVRIISGIVSGNRKEIVLYYGDIVRFSGGETEHPDEQLLQDLPPNCKGPFWVVGFEITSVQPTTEP